MGNIKKFLKSTTVYFLGNVLTRIISFFLLPLYTKLIATNDMGYFDYSTSLLNIIIPVVCLEIWAAIMRFMFDYFNKNEKYKVIFNGLVIFSISLVLYCSIFFVLGLTHQFDKLLYIFIYGMLMMLQMIYTYVVRGLGFNTIFAISGIISSLVNSISNIILMVCFGMRLDSLFVAVILSLLVQIVILEFKCKLLTNLKWTYFDFALIKEMIKFSLPLSINSASYWILSNYNRVAIKNILGLSANGIFSIASRFVTVLALVSTCLSLAWQELVFSKGNETNKSDFYNKASSYYLKFLCIALLMLIPAVKLVFPFLVDIQYQNAFSLIPINLLACCASIYAAFLGDIFGAEKKNNIVMYSTLAAAVVNIVVVHLLIGKIGLQAANIASFLGFALNIFIRILLLNKNIKLKIDVKFILLTAILFIVSCYVYLNLSNWGNLLFAFAIFVLSIFTFKDLYMSIINFISRKFKKQ